VLVLGALVLRVGAGPFVDGLRLTNAWSLLVATLVTAATTTCCAWRWQRVAAALGVRMDVRTAVLAVYRAQFLNATLPGGVIGDIDRALGHGRASRAVGPTVRSVVWERGLGQAVQLTISVAILLVLPSPLGGVAVVAAGLGAVLVLGVVASSRVPGRAARTVSTDLRAVLASRHDRTLIAGASATAVTGHLLVFLLAARVAGVEAPAYRILPIAVVVLLAAAVPANVAGWGPREGVAAWAFGAAGLGAATGVTTAVVYGVMALVATLPGAIVLLALRRTVVPADSRSLEPAHG
jgi:uncharacterized membrane protein YbhN (UPF0104 family)